MSPELQALIDSVCPGYVPQPGKMQGLLARVEEMIARERKRTREDDVGIGVELYMEVLDCFGEPPPGYGYTHCDIYLRP